RPRSDAPAARRLQAALPGDAGALLERDDGRQRLAHPAADTRVGAQARGGPRPATLPRHPACVSTRGASSTDATDVTQIRRGGAPRTRVSRDIAASICVTSVSSLDKASPSAPSAFCL